MSPGRSIAHPIPARRRRNQASTSDMPGDYDKLTGRRACRFL